MGLRDTLVRVLSDYRLAIKEPFTSHPMAVFVRSEGKKQVEKALGAEREGLKVTGSAGAGKWAEVPWLAIFDRSVTESATRGHYVVYLFHSTKPIAHLSLNQGTTAVRDEFGSAARTVLQDRAELIRHRISDFAEFLPSSAIELGSDLRLPGDYAAGHAMGITYDLAALPDEEKLRHDLLMAIKAYRALTYRGGLDPSLEIEGGLEDEFSLSSKAPIVEIRRYREHRRIERSASAAKSAKSFHGTRCQACSMSFVERYGTVGEGFIEAHHLRPIATLEEGVPVSYDIAEDFAVLCSNCHRMIHRMSDPSDVAGLREVLEMTGHPSERAGASMDRQEASSQSSVAQGSTRTGLERHSGK